MESTPYIKKFGASTSMHGASKFILTKSPTRRRLWLIIFVASWAMFIYQMYQVCGKYFEYPKQVNVDVAEGGVPFPWITICSLRGFKFHLVHRLREVYDVDTGVNISLLGDSPTDQFIRKYKELYSAIQIENKTLNKEFYSQDLLYANIPRKLIRANSMQIKEFLVSCKHEREECNYTRDFEEYFNWYYFNCYKYTGGKRQGDPDAEHPSLNIGVSDGWSAVVLAGRGMLGESEDPRLRILGVHDVTRASGGSEGVRVVIHPPYTDAFPMNEGYDVPPGYSVSLAFRPGIVKRVDKPYGECFDNTKENKSYRKILCMGLCRQESVRKQCGCKDPAMPHILESDSTMADIVENQSTMPHFTKNEKCFTTKSQGNQSINCKYCRFVNLNETISPENRVSEYLKNLKCTKDLKAEISRNSGMRASCDCKPPCSEYTYDVAYSLSKWPPTGFEGLGIWVDIFENRKFLDNFDKTTSEYELYKEYVQSNKLKVLKDFSRINVYVRDSNVVRTVEVPDYLLFQLLSDVGGQLGIWIGVSVITVTEAFEVLFLIVRNSFGRMCKRCKPVDDKDVNEDRWVDGEMMPALPTQDDELKSTNERDQFEIVIDPN